MDVKLKNGKSADKLQSLEVWLALKILNDGKKVVCERLFKECRDGREYKVNSCDRQYLFALNLIDKDGNVPASVLDIIDAAIPRMFGEPPVCNPIAQDE